MDLTDEALMQRAIEAAATVRTSTAPDPWVGCAIGSVDGSVYVGAARAPGGTHAENLALDDAGDAARGATLAITLEPCTDTGPTGSCVDAIIDAGIGRVLIGVRDPATSGADDAIESLRGAGIDVVVDVMAVTVEKQLAAYLHHRRTGRPYVVVRLSSTVDGRTAAPDASSRWITGDQTRVDGHRLRAESQAILVGAGAVRSENPALTTRLVEGSDPRRIVLGAAPDDAAIHPCLEWRGEIGELLDRLGGEGVLQLLVEGGTSTVTQFHAEGFVDRFVVYLAPALFGGDDALPMFHGVGTPTLDELRRGRFLDVRRVGEDLRLDLTLD